MRRLLPLALLALCACAAQAADNGPVARWTFDEGAGIVVKDTVGSAVGTLKGGEFVKCGTGYALRLQTADDYVDCDSPPPLSPTEAVTVSAWLYPEKLPSGGEAGVVGKTYENFLLTYYTDGKCWWYCGSGGKNVNATVSPGRWHHVVGTFGDDTLKLYVDGQLAGSCVNGQPKLRNTVPFLIGRTSGNSEYTRGAHFQGMIDDVSVYNRALTAEEVAQEYRTTHLTGLPDMRAFVRYASGEIMAQVGLRDVGPLPAGASVEVSVWRAGQTKPLAKQVVAAPQGGADAVVHLTSPTFAPGEYKVTARVLSPAKALVGLPATATVTWPTPPHWAVSDPNVKVLNNLVTELRRASNLNAAQMKLQFTNPREGWVFFTSNCAPGKGKIAISMSALQNDPTVIARDASSTGLAEGFRRLPAGRHDLLVECSGGAKVSSLIVRAVPEIGFCRLDCGPQIAGYTPKDWWGFLDKHILPNINLAVSRGAETRERYQAWHAQGKRWVVETQLPGIGKADGMTADEVYEAWAKSPGAANPDLDGILCDEFGAGDDPIWASWHEGLKRLRDTPSFKGKVFYPYCGPLYGAKASHAFVRTCFDQNWAAALERYFPEQHTEADAQAYIDANLTAVVKDWATVDPDVVAKTLIVWGMFCGSNETLDIDPEVDYHAFLDLQFNTLANDPTFFGLYGLTSYLSAYSDEETMRWIGQAYRHYCLEGRTDRMETGYQLHYVQNPDFAEGLSGWEVRAAEPGGVSAGSVPKLSWLEGRYPPTSRGDTCLIMKRSDTAPNTVSQTVKGLQPGRVYSLKLLSADYQDMLQEVSARKDLGLTVTLKGGEITPSVTFKQPFASCYAHVVGKFEAKSPAWFNLQNVVFRASAATAELTITDWPEGKPGGPAGQEILCNFVQLQPYELEK